MRELITAATSIALLLTTAHAVAQEDEEAPEFGSNIEEGLEPVDKDEVKKEQGYLGELTLGFRTGYALPFGKTKRGSDGGVPMSEVYAGQIPLWLDIGYEPLPNLMVGGYGLWGPALVAETGAAPDDTEAVGCRSGESCFGHVFRGGGQIHWMFSPDAKLNPWVGLGAAYEFAWMKRKADANTYKHLYRGPEIINFQVGADVKPKEELGFGPFASFSIDRFTNCKNTENGSPSARCDIERRAQHFWLLVGARVYFSAIQVKKKGVDLQPPP